MSDETAGVSLVVRKTVNAPQDRVFRMWTDPAILPRWWGPEGVICSGAVVDLRVGGTYRIGNVFPSGAEVFIEGEFELIEAPSKLVYTWAFSHEPEHVTRVTVNFEQRGGATEVVLIHERKGEREIKPGYEKGWQDCLVGLAAYADRLR